MDGGFRIEAWLNTTVVPAGGAEAHWAMIREQSLSHLSDPARTFVSTLLQNVEEEYAMLSTLCDGSIYL
jgi:hypothetical protein